MTKNLVIRGSTLGGAQISFLARGCKAPGGPENPLEASELSKVYHICRFWSYPTQHTQKPWETLKTGDGHQLPRLLSLLQGAVILDPDMGTEGPQAPHAPTEAVGIHTVSIGIV